MKNFRFQISDFRLQTAVFAASFFALFALNASAALTIDTGSVSNATRTNVTFYGNLSATNGSTNAISVILYRGTFDGSTNPASWAASNVFAGITNTCVLSTNVYSLTPATLYYWRWYSSEGTNTDWSGASSNFTTLAGVPTNTPAAAPYHPVMVDSNGNIVTTLNLSSINVVEKPYTPESHFVFADGTISLYFTSADPVVIPPTIGGVPVVNIGESSFMSSGVPSVTFPYGLTNIAHDAFAYCSYLTNVYFRGNAPSVHYQAFASSTPTIYYIKGATGFTTIWAGRPTAEWVDPDNKVMGIILNGLTNTPDPQGMVSFQCLTNATLFATAAQGAKADLALTNAAPFATAAQGIAGTNAQGRVAILETNVNASTVMYSVVSSNAVVTTNVIVNAGGCDPDVSGTYLFTSNFSGLTNGNWTNSNGFAVTKYSDNSYLPFRVGGIGGVGPMYQATVNDDPIGSYPAYNEATGTVTVAYATPTTNWLFTTNWYHLGTASIKNSTDFLQPVAAPASNTASGAIGQCAWTNSDGTNWFYYYDPNGLGTGTSAWVRIQGGATW